jgi:hypothetical protein
MQVTSWSRSYLIILLMAIFLVPMGGFVAAFATAVKSYLLDHLAQQNELPAMMAFFYWHGVSVIAITVVASLLSIICLAVKRHSAVGTIVSAIIFAVTLAFFFFAIFASDYPYSQGSTTM